MNQMKPKTLKVDGTAICNGQRFYIGRIPRNEAQMAPLGNLATVETSLHET
jgi:hypothetical protein